MALSRPCTATSQHLRHACLHRVQRHCLCFFFWLKSANTVLRAPPFLTVLAGSITSRSIGVVGNCLIGQLIGFALQARTRASLLSTCDPDTRRHTLLVAAGQEIASESGVYLFYLIAGFAIGVCTCATLCCTQRGVSREILVATEQLSFVNR